MSERTLRIAILAHSTNPRGGVVHALELADALVALGHECAVHAPDPRGKGFFRPSACETVSVAARPVGRSVRELVETRVADYVDHFTDPEHRRFDVFHAQDGISANALATLKQRGLIAGFVRTVHHIDVFDDPVVAAMQQRSIVAANRHLAVSTMWRQKLAADFGIEATTVGNGVDRRRYHPRRDGSEPALRERLGLRPGPIILAVGGVEERKNTLRLLEAFAGLLPRHPGAQLVIAGGASLLDHDGYQRRYALAKAEVPLPPRAVVETGPLTDADMPALYRLADVLAFPSVKEGFGLVVLEAMASGVPVVTSSIAPFTEYLESRDVEWCDPFDVSSIRDAIQRALWAPHRAGLVERGAEVARRHDWGQVAHAHLPVYEALREPLDA
jgi:glycosyltransferase-like protein